MRACASHGRFPSRDGRRRRRRRSGGSDIKPPPPKSASNGKRLEESSSTHSALVPGGGGLVNQGHQSNQSRNSNSSNQDARSIIFHARNIRRRISDSFSPPIHASQFGNLRANHAFRGTNPPDRPGKERWSLLVFCGIGGGGVCGGWWCVVVCGDTKTTRAAACPRTDTCPACNPSHTS